MSAHAQPPFPSQVNRQHLRHRSAYSSLLTMRRSAGPMLAESSTLTHTSAPSRRRLALSAQPKAPRPSSPSTSYCSSNRTLHAHFHKIYVLLGQQVCRWRRQPQGATNVRWWALLPSPRARQTYGFKQPSLHSRAGAIS